MYRMFTFAICICSINFVFIMLQGKRTCYKTYQTHKLYIRYTMPENEQQITAVLHCTCPLCHNYTCVAIGITVQLKLSMI